MRSSSSPSHAEPSPGSPHRPPRWGNTFRPSLLEAVSPSQPRSHGLCSHPPPLAAPRRAPLSNARGSRSQQQRHDGASSPQRHQPLCPPGRVAPVPLSTLIPATAQRANPQSPSAVSHPSGPFSSPPSGTSTPRHPLTLSPPSPEELGATAAPCLTPPSSPRRASGVHMGQIRKREQKC